MTNKPWPRIPTDFIGCKFIKFSKHFLRKGSSPPNFNSNFFFAIIPVMVDLLVKCKFSLITAFILGIVKDQTHKGTLESRTAI